MLIDLKPLFCGENDSIDISCELDFSGESLLSGKPLQKPVTVKGSIKRRAQVVFFDATATVTVTGTAPQEVIVGDLDNDGAVTDADAVYLLMYTFFPDDYPINQACDFDGDGDVTDADAVYLLMYTFFPEDYPIVKQQPPIEPGDPGETEPDPFED